ncbi:MAG: MbnP family protein [Bacteroidota bacterium]|nr:MbnP family protein [Bacteroidota bacterium]
MKTCFHFTLKVFAFILISTRLIGQEIDYQLRASLFDQTIDTVHGNPFGESIVFVKKLKFYIYTTHNGQTTPDRALLLSLKNPKQTMSTVRPFQIFFGVDSLLNYNGIHEGALDPINDMYWTWQTGYIHCKLEGYILNHTTKQNFEYHIGGYSSKDRSPLWIGQKSDGKSLELNFELYPAIEWALKNKVFNIMSPGKLSDEMVRFLGKGITII